MEKKREENITCAEKSMSLVSCSLHPISLFKKSKRLPKDNKTEQLSLWVLLGCMFACVGSLYPIPE